MPLWYCMQVPPEHIQARKAYEARWQRFNAAAQSPGTKLAYIDIPWPAEEFASDEELQQAILAGTVVRRTSSSNSISTMM